MCVRCPQWPKEGVESRYVTEEAKAHIKMIEHTGKNIRVVESRSDPKVVVSKRDKENLKCLQMLASLEVCAAQKHHNPGQGLTG